VLIFCSSRKGCESTARHVSKFLKKFSVNVRNGESEFVDVTSAVDALRRCPVGLDPILEETFPSGVAYHHAGLTVFICFYIYLSCWGCIYFIISRGIFLIAFLIF
jgi:DNA polymerase theta